MARDPLHTVLCDRLGIEHPIIAFTHCKDVAVAVINAGAFAVYGAAPHSPDEIAADIKWIRDRIGGKQFGMDLLLPAAAPPAGTIDELRAQIPDEHRRFVESMEERYQIPPPKGTVEHFQLGWINQDRARKQLDVVLEERVPVLAFGLGSPAFIIEAAHERGIQVWGLVGKPRQARREIEAGVDAIIAQGTDAAGHTGSIGTFSIVPAVAAIAGDVPVIAAGGITTGQHLAAALCLGAAAVWTGTVWLPSRESDVDIILKEKLIAATAEDTVHSKCMSGFSMRILRCTWTEEWEKPEAPEPLPAPYQLLLGGELHQAVKDYRIEPFMTDAAGQGVGFVTSMKPARQIVFDMVDDARTVLEGLTSDAAVPTTTG
jgi:NAD(P)H-dependent flavin oxidoreductase YrpB (nitropropane dioxygenase family)